MPVTLDVPGIYQRLKAQLVGVWRIKLWMKTCPTSDYHPSNHDTIFHLQGMIDRFVPQMRGNNQQDSQEFLAFLMDGLHEDLNRVKKRQYITDVDNSKLGDGEAAKLAWINHKKQNDSIIVDYFQV